MFDCEKWMDESEWVGTLFLIENGELSGLEINNPDEKMDNLILPILENIENEKVIYGAVEANKNNVGPDASFFFPFRDMRQAVYFETTKYGCKVTQTVSYKPKGIIGWFTCKFILVPQVTKGIDLLNNKLIGYLKNA
jgi:hypothetical protein